MLSIGSWQSNVLFRNLVIRDTGFLPYVSPIRRGDYLYNAGTFRESCDYYMRLLRSQTSSEEVMELRYKTGMCLLNLDSCVQAREWLMKVLSIPESGFWHERALLGLLEIEWKENNREHFEQKARQYFKSSALQDGMRELFGRLGTFSASRGFFERAVFAIRLMHEIEDPKTHGGTIAEFSLASSCRMQRHWKEAVTHFGTIIQNPNAPKSMVIQSYFGLRDVYAWQGDFIAADNAIHSIRNLTKNNYDCARCLVYEALNNAGRGKFDDALKVFQSVERQYPSVEGWAMVAEQEKMQILCGLEKGVQAKEVLITAQKKYNCSFF